MKNLKSILLLTCLMLFAATLSFGQGILNFQNGYHVGSSLAAQAQQNGQSCVTSFSSWPQIVRTTIQQYQDSENDEYANGVRAGFQARMPICSWQNNVPNDPTGQCTTCQTWEWEP